MDNGAPRSMTARERIWLSIFVVVAVGVAVTFQLARSLGFEPWMLAAGFAGGAAITPWVWYQTRSRS